MTATTIASYSDEITAGLAPLYAPIKANVHNGKVRCINWRLTLASQTSGTSIAVAKLPKGARILSGVLAASGTLANSATLAVGLAGVDGSGYIDDALAGGPGYKPDGSAVTTGTPVDDSTTCLKAAAAQGATQVPFAITTALGYLYETAKEVWVTLTTGTGTVSTEVVRGHIFYAIE